MKKGIILILFSLFVFSCTSQEEKSPELVKALIDNNIIPRGQIHKIENEYRLDYYDVYEKDSHMEFLKNKGYQSGGASWSGIIYGAIKLSDDKILTQIRFDDEAEGIAIWSKNRKCLEKVSRLISVVKSDNKLLLKCISIANKNWKME
ncbi:hypothetical protein FDT66_13080 [Polaribacter aestuariivivens]|uniref:Lipoprotein n=1 Tax=Polaribacter aestuariivivens TaxID=2304626 RepID=A0A5S3N0Z2_9FLAO|nr:Imm51 family immunity protein [Polaribacter aestuariivivens]TMM28833.1 hypothetical protein FDT66_13080 [Polaribacter aestuariivivens]